MRIKKPNHSGSACVSAYYFISFLPFTCAAILVRSEIVIFPSPLISPFWGPEIIFLILTVVAFACTDIVCGSISAHRVLDVAVFEYDIFYSTSHNFGSILDLIWNGVSLWCFQRNSYRCVFDRHKPHCYLSQIHQHLRTPSKAYQHIPKYTNC